MPRPARDDGFGQPDRVEEVVRNYLDMTKPRREGNLRRTEEQRSASDAQRTERRPRARLIDNEGLSLEDGNDFA
jgi:hypothetical protein